MVCIVQVQRRGTLLTVAATAAGAELPVQLKKIVDLFTMVRIPFHNNQVILSHVNA
jgi:hypothetical protein